MAESKDLMEINRKLAAFKSQLASRETMLIDLLQGDKNAAKRFMRIAGTAVANNPKLLECTPLSLMRAFFTAAEFNLEPNTPAALCYVIPYDNWNPATKKKEKQAQFQLGYHGICELAYRSGQVKAIRARVIHENDKYQINYGLDETLTHSPAMADAGKSIGVYAVIELTGGTKHFTFMSMDDCLEHAKKFSKSWAAAEKSWDGKDPKRDSTWHTNPEAMAMKTVVIAALKFASKSVEDNRLVSAIHADFDNDSEVKILPDNSVIDTFAEIVEHGNGESKEDGELPMEGE